MAGKNLIDRINDVTDEGFDPINVALAIDNFARQLSEGVQAKDAFRKAFDITKAKPIDYYRQAEELALEPRVQKIVAEYKKKAAEVLEQKRKEALEAPYDIAHAMADARMAYNAALQKENAGAMVAASTLMAKLHGLLVDKQEVKTSPLKGYSDEELDAEIARATAALLIDKAKDGRKDSATEESSGEGAKSGTE